MRNLLSCLLFVCSIAAYAEMEQIDIAHFSQGDISSWQTKVFAGETHYAFATTDGRTALHANSTVAASGLFRKVNIDLKKTPILHWSWKVDNVLAGGDELTRAGDDYPARVYVVFSGGAAFWRARAINYVWSSKQPIDSSWRNAFTGNARMIAVQSGSALAGQWLEERRDVLADYRRLFGSEPSNVEAIAIMTDTDNTGATASAWYGDIWFTAK